MATQRYSYQPFLVFLQASFKFKMAVYSCHTFVLLSSFIEQIESAFFQAPSSNKKSGGCGAVGVRDKMNRAQKGMIDKKLLCHFLHRNRMASNPIFVYATQTKGNFADKN